MKRQSWIKVHRWIGLLLGLHWLLLAATGLVLVFHREIETAWIGAGPAVTQGLDVDGALNAVTRASGETARTVVIEDQPVRALRVFADKRIYTVDAASGAILSVSGSEGGASPTGVIRFIYELHHKLVAGVIGEWLVGFSGVFLLVTVVFGLKLAWPRRGGWKAIIRPRIAGRPWQRHYVVHRSVGMFAAVAILSASLTGMGIIWSAGLGRIMGDVPVETVPAATLPRLYNGTANGAIALAKAQLPGSKLVRVDLPVAGRSDFTVRLREPGEIRPVFGTSVVTIKAATGEVLSVRAASKASFGTKAIAAFFPIHNGSWLGLAGRFLVILQGLALIYLTVSGAIVWNARRKRG